MKNGSIDFKHGGRVAQSYNPLSTEICWREMGEGAILTFQKLPQEREDPGASSQAWKAMEMHQGTQVGCRPMRRLYWLEWLNSRFALFFCFFKG